MRLLLPAAWLRQGKCLIVDCEAVSVVFVLRTGGLDDLGVIAAGHGEVLGNRK